jgi:hypothetical protein
MHHAANKSTFAPKKILAGTRCRADRRPAQARHHAGKNCADVRARNLSRDVSDCRHDDVALSNDRRLAETQPANHTTRELARLAVATGDGRGFCPARRMDRPRATREFFHSRTVPEISRIAAEIFSGIRPNRRPRHRRLAGHRAIRRCVAVFHFSAAGKKTCRRAGQKRTAPLPC